jgi:hypothetical protein
MPSRHTDPAMPGLVQDKPGHDEERMGSSASAAGNTRMKFLNELAAELPIEAGSEFEKTRKKQYRRADSGTGSFFEMLHPGQGSRNPPLGPRPGISHPSWIEQNENKVKICCSIFCSSGQDTRMGHETESRRLSRAESDGRRRPLGSASDEKDHDGSFDNDGGYDDDTA